ncbi:DUF3857 domain-containing protein [Paenimyroides baculatum]|uniref:DUF3857 domain-containing protein n=1 Tax=Paenimyroides baculatum TaxID=2608000 RepID=A0A5M6CT08_9FLAO|nr:DUF3857 domain-containing protein [Paenimyroides baculatum]KAA5538076.1 DUF3857 domain-containing protein [Paenimyroides baculatum]
MIKIKSVLLTLFISVSVWNMKAQKFEFKNYEFSTAEYKIDPKFQKEEEIILERHIKSEFVFEDDTASEYRLVHEKKLINSDNAIERNNKVYIPAGMNDNLIANKLRVILKNGKIIELKQSDIKEEIDEQRQTKYNYFAVNGLEKGAIIEKFHIIKKEPEISGSSLKLQSNAPVLRTTIELIYPERLLFSSASYNGFPKAESKLKSYKEKNSLFVEAFNIPSIPDNERQSNMLKNSQRFSYKLDENISTNTKNIHNHSDYAKSLYEAYHRELSKAEEKALENFIKKFQKTSDPLAQIQNIEKNIKENIQYNRYFSANENLADIIKNKQGNLFDLLKLYANAYKKMNVPYEIVFTTDRFQNIFDPNFESYLNFKEVLFYFPTADVYVEPGAPAYRTPMFDDQFAGNHGLFVKTKTFGGIKVPVSEIKTIEFPKNQSMSVMDIHVDFSNSVTDPALASKIKFNGYESLNFQPAKDFSDPTEYQEMLTFIAKNYIFESEIASVEAKNEGLEFVGKEHFVIDVKANAKDLITKAGNNYIFKVGEVIGKQMEMYEEKERVLPIEIDNPHSYDRTITLTLPADYKIKNPEVFNMNQSLTYQGKVVADFISSYEIKGNQLIVKNTEHYEFVELPASVYPQYQKIINAAADFNKLSVILEKK